MLRTQTDHLTARPSKKGQMKIQEMAFMIVGVVIFFSMVALVYVTLTVSKVRSDAEKFEDQEALEIARKLSATPEFIFTASSDCSSCIDLDRVIHLSSQPEYQNFWNLEYLTIEIIYPEYAPAKCTISSYASKSCNVIEIISQPSNIATKSAFVTLARYDSSTNSYKYELGKIHASAENPE